MMEQIKKQTRFCLFLVADRMGYISWDVILDRRKENGIPGELSKYDEGVQET
jgi:hypothetical protein